MPEIVTSRRLAGRRAERPTELLLEVSNRMALSANLDEALAVLHSIAASTVGTERSSIFLEDPASRELVSRIPEGSFTREIRILNTAGIAGHVFQTGDGVIIEDAYKDPRFDPNVDSMTGFVTKNILCVPLRTVKGTVIGVAELLNKIEGKFEPEDLKLLQAIVRQAAIVLESHRTVEIVERERRQELEFLSVVSEISTELNLSVMLKKVMTAVTTMLNAERSTLFINDEKTGELYTEVGQGLGTSQIRLANNLGIAGMVFNSGESVNIPYAYADLRFNPAVDRRTGFFTRSMLCVPVVNKDGKRIGVTQVLNKSGGTFTEEDEARLKAFTSQVAIGLENAKLFADVQNIKNYNEGILQSMTNGLLTLDNDGKVKTSNEAAFKILKVGHDEVIGKSASELFGGTNSWLAEKLTAAQQNGKVEVLMDAELDFKGEKRSVNLTVQPLRGDNATKLGSILMLDDISTEKRMKSTMARHMDPSVAEKLLQSGEEALGGQSNQATILFSDIRSFTTLTEELGPQGTVSLLNEYFTLMVDRIQSHGGTLDKFIGDALMGVFGTPLAHEDDEDRAVRAAISMLEALSGWNAKRAEHGLRGVDIGVGLNTDVVVSGNIGSPKRMDYTVIGDGVNLASRLESANKLYGSHILLSEFTVAKLKSTYRLREIDNVVVKGKTKPVGVFEILDYHGEQSFPNMRQVLSTFQFGLEAYRGGKFDQALKAFEEAHELHPADRPAVLYLERCRHLIENPPGDGWEGVWVMKEK
jgi:adenylate cyclase